MWPPQLEQAAGSWPQACPCWSQMPSEATEVSEGGLWRTFNFISINKVAFLNEKKCLFYGLKLTIKSLTHYELIFVAWDGGQVAFFHMWLSSFLHTIHWKNSPFPIVCSWLLCHKLIVHICVDFILDYVFCSTHLFLYQSHTVLITIALHYNLKPGIMILPLCSCLSKLDWLFRIFCGEQGTLVHCW